MNPDEITLTDHEARLSVLEAGCGKCPSAFKEINCKLDKVQETMNAFLLREARQTGFWRGAEKILFGAGGGLCVIVWEWLKFKWKASQGS